MKLYNGDCRLILPTLEAESFTACVTDPPYHLTTGKKGGSGPASLNVNSPAGRSRVTTGFMGKSWDGGDVAMRPETWAEVLRVLKPGAYMLCFGGTRTYHRLACAIEDAGFEIRDCIMWIYGTGFPKGKGCLKPAYEPILLCRKPGPKVLPLGIDECRIGTDEELRSGTGNIPCRHDEAVPRGRNGQASAETRYTENGGTNFAAKPGPRGGDSAGRWPANIIHDGSEEVLSGFPHTSSGTGAVKSASGAGYSPSAFGKESRPAGTPNIEYGDSGSAARFFYCAKASKSDRGEGNTHPTVKPLSLMEYLVKLVTMPGENRILDPFAGSGTTLLACDRAGIECVGIELEAEHVSIVEKRDKRETGKTPLFA